MDTPETAAFEPPPSHASAWPAPSQPDVPAGLSERTRIGLAVAAVSLGAGILADRLVWVPGVALNLLVWTAALAAVLLALAVWLRLAWTPARYALLALAVGCAALAVWRDSATLKSLAALGWLVAFALVAVAVPGWSLRRLTLFDQAAALVLAGLNAALAVVPLLAFDVRWREVAAGGRSARVMALTRGVLIAVPVLALFGGLLMAADAAFEGIVVNVLRINLADFIIHSVLSLCLAWFVAGYLRGALLGGGLPRRPSLGAVSGAQVGSRAVGSALTQAGREVDAAVGALFRLGAVEIGVVLGLLDALFLGFVLVQFRYFFGGAALVETSVTLTYAEYARRGFFELVWVAGLALSLLLALHWLLRPGDRRAARWFAALAALQIMLLFVIMASAVERMRLYVGEFGLTELRLYTTAFVGWLAVVLVWFAATVLRGRRAEFAFGAFVAGYLLTLGLHALNPDALVVRINVERAQAGARFDAGYAASLSADAVPALVAALPDLSPADRYPIQQRLERRGSYTSADWRTWSLSRAAAEAAVDGYTPLPDERPAPTPGRQPRATPSPR